MKKELLFGIALWGVSLVSHGQDTNAYQSFFGQESTVWNGVTESYDTDLENHVLQVAYDTVLDGKEYKKIRYSHNGYQTPRYDFFLREDTTTGRLWCRYADEDEDFIIADMSLSVGDSIYLHNKTLRMPGIHLEIVQRVDTIDSKKIITLNGDGFYRTPIFIEGVGCSNLLDYTRYDFNIGSEIICCHKDDSLVYHNTRYANREEGCVIKHVGIGEIEEDARVSVFPNPCSNWVIVDGGGVESIQIYNLQGCLIKTSTGRQKHIDVSMLPNGAYFLNIITNGSIVYKKIIKQ